MMLGAGGILSVQSEINGRLARSIGEGTQAGLTAATISFGSGLVILAVITAVTPRHRQGVRSLVAALRARRLRPIELVGGALGAWLVATQGLTVGTIGVALFSVAMTAGQSASALAVDHIGLGPSGHQPFSVPRAIAAVFAVAAVVLAASERLIDDFSWEVAVFATLPFIAGAGLAVQQAINGRVAQHAGAWTTTLNNFTVGTAVLLLVLGVTVVARGLPDRLPGNPWLYVGGALGIAFIWITALLVHVHGVLVLGLCLIAGQVVTAQAIEIGSGETHVGPVGVAAGGLTVVGVVVALLRRRQSAT